MWPLGATWTLMTSPHLRPSGPFILAGSVGHPGSSRYGLGSVGFGTGFPAGFCACGVVASAATTKAQIRTWEPARPAAVILHLGGTIPWPPRRGWRFTILPAGLVVNVFR